MSKNDYGSNTNKVLKNQNIDIDEVGDYAIQPVPLEKRRNFFSIMWVNAGFTINLGTIFGGAALAAFLPLYQVFIALAISALIQIAIAVPIGAIGAKYGLTTSLLSRQSFGRKGSWLIALTLAISLGIGWFGWQVALFADTIHALAPNTFLTGRVIACIWGGAIMILTATIGFKAMTVLSYVVVPMMITFFGFGVISSLTQTTLSFSEILTQAPEQSGSLAAGVTVAIGMTIAGCLGMADITRYAKTPAQAGASGTLGYLGGALFCELSGALIYKVSGLIQTSATPNLIEAMLKLGLGAGALIMLIAAQWSTNDNNLYSGALGLTNVIKIKKPVASVIMGTVGIIIAIMGIQDYFVPFLSTLGMILPPFGGIIISHHFFVRPFLKSDYALKVGEKLTNVNVLSIVVTLGSALISYFLQSDTMPGAIVGIVIAFVGYPIFTFILTKLGIKFNFGEYEITESGF